MASTIEQDAKQHLPHEECLRKVNLALSKIDSSIRSIVKNNGETLGMLEPTCRKLKPPNCDTTNIATIYGHLQMESKISQESLEASRFERAELISKKELINVKLVELRIEIDQLMADEHQLKSQVELNQDQQVLFKLMQ